MTKLLIWRPSQVLLMILMLVAVTATGAEAKPAKTIDLTGVIKGMHLKEGLNLIHTTPEGVKFFAKVKGGKIVGYALTDKVGRNIPLIEHGGVAGGRICQDCWVDSDTGKLYCYNVPCPPE